MASPMYTKTSPPWSGPTGEAAGMVPIARQLQGGEKAPTAANYPFKPATDQNPNLFPPVCLRSHWDPTKILQRTLPQVQVPTPLDPRPWTKVCLSYVTSSKFEEAPHPPDTVVYPMGGTVYPPTRYIEGIDNESALRRLDRPLGTCERDQYIPPRSGDMYVPNMTLPDRMKPDSQFVSELSIPQATLRDGEYACVKEVMDAAWARSPMPFNNATKQARYAVSHREYVRQPSQPIPQEKVRLA